jgi:hypothetical protein
VLDDTIIRKPIRVSGVFSGRQDAALLCAEYGKHFVEKVRRSAFFAISISWLPRSFSNYSYA